MFAINVAQLAALGQVYDTLWVTLFPALVFAAFILAFILQWWWQQRRSERSVLNFRRAWQQSLIRVANGLTLVLCVAICEFIYLNNYAIPDFEDKQWATSFNASSTLPMPAFALTRAVGVRRTADLVDKSPTFSSACQDFERNSTGPGLDRCFSPVKTLNAAGLGEVEYIIYDGADQTQLGVSSSVDLHFQYQCNQNAAIPIPEHVANSPKSQQHQHHHALARLHRLRPQPDPKLRAGLQLRLLQHPTLPRPLTGRDQPRMDPDQRFRRRRAIPTRLRESTPALRLIPHSSHVARRARSVG